MTPTSRKHPTPAEKQKAYRKRLSEARTRELQAKGLPASPAIPSMPGAARWKAMKEAALTLLDATLSEMEDYRDERSDAWRDDQRGEAFEEAVEQVREACDCIAAIC